MGSEGVRTGDAGFFDFEYYADDLSVIRQTGGVEVGQAAVFLVEQIIADLEIPGGFQRSAEVGILAGFKHPAVLCSRGGDIKGCFGLEGPEGG